jgi:hypothetical protein
MVMTTLDDRLYTWLSQVDERRFTLAFNSYLLLAFPAVVRHLARFAPSDPALLAEIAQDSLLKFFERIGRARRAASLQFSRNKVQYVIETPQDAYVQFAARSAGAPHPLPTGGGPSHAS